MRRLRDVGQLKRVNALLANQMAAFANQSKGKLFALNYSLVVSYVRNGDINTTECYAARNRALLSEAQRRPVFPIYGMALQALVEVGNARIEEARGRFGQAKAAYHKAFDPVHERPQNGAKPAEGRNGTVCRSGART